MKIALIHEAPFTPITITLESFHEAGVLMALLSGMSAELERIIANRIGYTSNNFTYELYDTIMELPQMARIKEELNSFSVFIKVEEDN